MISPPRFGDPIIAVRNSATWFRRACNN